MMTGQRNKRLKYIVVTLSLLCYLTACVLSPFNYYENTEDAPYKIMEADCFVCYLVGQEYYSMKGS